MGTQTRDLAVLTEETFGVDREHPLAALLVGRGHPEHQRIGRPRGGFGPRLRGPRHDLELVNAGRPLAVRGAQAVRPGVAAADDDHPLVLGGDGRLAVGVEDRVAVAGPVGPRQVLHRLVDAIQFPARDGQVAPGRRAAGKHHRVEALPQLLGGDVHADVDAGAEHGALGRHLLQPTVDVALLHLELGNAIAQQAPDAVRPLEDRHLVARPGQLLGRGQARRPGADDGHRLAGDQVRRVGPHPALVEGVVDDLDLDLLDGHRVLVDAQDTGGLAGRRAQPAGELREVVGGVQPLDGVPPAVPVDQVVPLRDQVAQRTAVVAERDSAVHAARGLFPQRLVIEVLVDLVPVPQPQRDRPALRGLPPGVLQKAARISHGTPP